MISPASLLAVLLFGAASAQPCFGGCSFELCSGKTTLTAGRADVALTGALCLPIGDEIENIARTGQALVDGVTNISAYAPAGLLQGFAPTFFKGFGAGIGHEAPQQNQVEFLPNLCVAIPLLAYSARDSDNVTMNFMSNEPSNCIALQVKLGRPAVSPTAPSPPPPNRSPFESLSMPPRPSSFFTESITPSPFGVVESLPPLASVAPEPVEDDEFDVEVETMRTTEPVESFASDPTLTLESLTPRPSEGSSFES